MGRRLNIEIIYYSVFAVFTLLVVLPVVYTLFYAAMSKDFYQNLVLIDSDTLLLLGKSSLIAASVAFLATLTGGLTAYILYLSNSKANALFKILLLLPLFISPYILAVAWQDFFFFVFADTHLINSYTGLVLILTNVFFPLSMLIIGSAISNIDARIIEAALLVVDKRRAVLKIVLPLIKPAIIASFVLIFIFSISEFSVPAFLGVKVYTREIFTQFSAFYNHSLSILQSLLLVVICILLLLAEGKYISNAPFLSLGGKGARSIKTRTSKRSILLLMFVILTAVAMPLSMLVIQSFRDGTGNMIKAFNLLGSAIINSLVLAVGGAFIILLTGFVVALRSKGKEVRRPFDWMLLITFSLPSIILGISLIKFYNRPELNFIYSSFVIILIAYAGKFSFIAAKLTENGIKQVPLSLFEAAEVSGIRYRKQVSKILLPLIMPSVLAAFVIGFIFAFEELGMTIMLYPPGTDILPIKVFTLSANTPQSLTSSMSLIVLLITLLFVSGFYLITKPFTRKI